MINVVIACEVSKNFSFGLIFCKKDVEKFGCCSLIDLLCIAKEKAGGEAKNDKTFKNYYKEFYVAQTKTVRDKINFVLKLVETQRIIPKKFFRIIEGSEGIYEIRVEIESNIYRIFCCMDGGAVVVLFHGFQKKSEKTPQKEIKRAEALKREYFNSKEAE